MSSVVDSFFRPISVSFSPLEIFAGATTVAFAGCLSLYMLSQVLTPSFTYNGKHILITGGSSGIGLECAKLYAKAGANVTIVARGEVKLAKAIQQIKPLLRNGRDVMSISVDTASSEETVSNSFAPAVKRFGSVDVLLNCAGTSVASEFNELDSEAFEKMMKINVLGSIFPTRAVLPAMKEKKSGRVIFVSSQVAQAAIYGYTAYGASKWALRGLAEALQMELKPYNIYVSVSYPPDTDTPGYQEEMKDKPKLTKKLSESGTVFKPDLVAKDIVTYSAKGYFGISSGLDGWLLKQVHQGMTPVNNLWEFVQGVLFSSIARFIAMFYIVAWDVECRNEMLRVAKEVERQQGEKTEKNGSKNKKNK